MPVSFLVRAKSGYYLDEEINKMYAHQTGPPETGQTEVVRNVVVFGVRIPGKRTVSEEGHLDNSEPEPEDGIDTEFTQVPDVPHGLLSDAVLRSVQRVISEIKKHGTMVFTTMPKSDTETNNANIKEARKNMLKSNANLRPINDFIRFKHGESESPFIRDFCTKLVRTIATELRVPDAQYMVAESARHVIDPADLLHIDSPVLGPGVLVVATGAQSAYKVMLARMKEGCRAGGVLHRRTPAPESRVYLSCFLSRPLFLNPIHQPNLNPPPQPYPYTQLYLGPWRLGQGGSSGKKEKSGCGEVFFIVV